jgi:hypothetical protein
MDFVCVCIRVPKSGSSSLGHALDATFADRRAFFLPDTLDLDGRYSGFQRWRFRRSRGRALKARYGDPRIETALSVINGEARPGDLVTGGHIDFGFARANLTAPVKIITLLREPAARCVSEYNYARANHLRRDVFKRFDSKGLAKAAGRYNLVGYLDYLLERREAYGDLASRYLGWDGAEPLKAFHERCVFHAGVLEETRAFAFGLSEKLGRPVDLPWANSTLTDRFEGADAEALSRIEQLYPRDLELYEHQLGETRRTIRGDGAQGDLALSARL